MIWSSRWAWQAISKSQVSRLCGELDERVGAFLSRPLEGDWPYVWLDATYIRSRGGGRAVNVAVVVAVGVNQAGRREVLGIRVMPSEAEAFWAEFLRELTHRGLRGVQLVVSDAHQGLKAATAKVLGAGWQRCPGALHVDLPLLGIEIEDDPARAAGPLMVYASHMRSPSLGRAGAWLLDDVGARPLRPYPRRTRETSAP